MIISEKNRLEQEDNSSSCSSKENEFQELDNEIEKVVRGGTSYEEEETKNKDSDLNKSSNISQISKSQNNLNTNNSFNNCKNCISEMDDKTNLNNIYNNKYYNKASKSFKNNLDTLNVSKKSVVNSKKDNNYNKININFNKNINNNYNNSNYNFLIQENYNKSKTNQKVNSINLNQNMNFLDISGNLNNNNQQKLISMNINSNNCINNMNILNNIDCSNGLGNQINNYKNMNINNLFSNMNNYFYSYLFNDKSLYNDINNKMIINNQIFNPINISVQLTNNNINNIDPNNNYYLLNQINNNKDKFNFPSFNYNVNNDLGQFIRLNNNPQIDLNSFNNTAVNSQIEGNNKIMLNLLANHLQNKYLKDLIENNNNLHQFNFVNNNSNNQNNKYNIENNVNNPIKRKIFNPLSDSEKERNIVNLMDIFQCKDLRTTLMIKNIPNKYTLTSFLEEINQNFKNTYDIFYLPIDYINKCNLGFAFINFVEPFHIILFYEKYRGKKWKKFNSDKICELLYAKFQGRKELISHFEKGKVLSFDSEEKRPLILPIPHPLPKINIPIYYLDLFIKLYPYISYRIKNINNNNRNDDSSIKIFSINGNFIKN